VQFSQWAGPHRAISQEYGAYPASIRKNLVNPIGTSERAERPGSLSDVRRDGGAVMGLRCRARCLRSTSGTRPVLPKRKNKTRAT